MRVGFFVSYSWRRTGGLRLALDRRVPGVIMRTQLYCYIGVQRVTLSFPCCFASPTSTVVIKTEQQELPFLKMCLVEPLFGVLGHAFVRLIF